MNHFFLLSCSVLWSNSCRQLPLAATIYNFGLGYLAVKQISGSNKDTVQLGSCSAPFSSLSLRLSVFMFCVCVLVCGYAALWLFTSQPVKADFMTP